MAFVSCSKDKTETIKPEGMNKSIIYNINYSNAAEINMGSLAESKGYGSVVKDYGKLMVQEHQKAQNELKTISSKRNINMPSGLSQEDQNTRSLLSNLSGISFDTTYISSQITAHLKTRDMFLAFLDTSKDVELLSYAGKYLPVIIRHLAKADSIASTLGVKPKS